MKLPRSPWPSEVAPRPSPRPAKEFWTAFAEQATQVPQDQPEPAVSWRLSAGMALALAVFLLWLGPWWKPAVGAIGILQLDVPIEHEGVLVLQSSDVPGVVVVIDGVPVEP